MIATAETVATAEDAGGTTGEAEEAATAGGDGLSGEAEEATHSIADIKAGTSSTGVRS